MRLYSIKTAEANFEEIVELLESNMEDEVVIYGKGKKPIKITRFDSNPRDSLFGCGKGLFEIPEGFDDIDITKDFSEEIS